MIKMALFDFDDTICLTEEAAFNFENQVLNDMGFPPMSREIHKETWGMILKEAIVIRAPGIDADEFVRRQEKYFGEFMSNGNFDNIPEENLEVLRTLKEKGIKVAILTNRSLGEVKHLTHDKHPFADLLDAFYHKDNTPFRKPDPKAFDNAFRDFKFSPKEMIYAGDSVGDAAASTGAGIRSIVVLESGIRQKEDFKDYPVEFFADKFTDVLAFILSL